MLVLLFFLFLMADNFSPPDLQKIKVKSVWSQKYEKTTIKDLADNEIKWLSFKNKVVLVNLWATWCPPCVKELPSFEKLYKKFESEESIIFMFVTEEDRETINEFLRRKYYYLPICTVSAGKFPLEEHNNTNNGGAIPATYIVVPESKEAYYHVGSAQWDDQSVIDFLNKLLKEVK